MDTTDNPLKNKIILYGMILSVTLLFASLFFSVLLNHFITLSLSEALVTSRLAIWFVLLIVYIYTLKVEKLPLVLWKDQRYSILYYIKSVILTVLVVYASMVVLSTIVYMFNLSHESSKLKKLGELFRNNYWLLIFTSLTAGVTEELLFRAYLIPRLQLFFKKPYMSAILSSVIFGLLHFGFGTAINVLGPIVIGIIFSFHYLKYRNIKILIICHFIWDCLILFLMLYRTPG